jgi:cytochrome c oxidase subunit 3/cytochrome o ubiquinol oxidase subunit 3
MQHAEPMDHEHLVVEAPSMGVDHRKLLMWLFLGSEGMFFGSLIATYILYRGRSVSGPYPGHGFEYNIPYTSVSSFVLLMSSLTMVLALAAVQRGDQRALRTWLLATATLGLVFVGGQAFEFTSFVAQGVTIHTNLFGSSFFTLTGFHGAHVTVGIIMLLSLWVMALRGRITSENSLTVELAGLYWHFVDVVWILIFTLVYLIKG